MRLQIDSACKVGRGLSVKREKDDGGDEILRCHLTVSEVFVDRETVDELCGQPIGWTQSTLFTDEGIPVARLVLGLPKAQFTVTGTLGGTSGDPLRLQQAEASGISLELTKLGAVLSCRLAWETAGDEAEGVEDLLGRMASAKWTVSDGGQNDLFKAAEAFKDKMAASGGGSIQFSNGERIDIPAAGGAA